MERGSNKIRSGKLFQLHKLQEQWEVCLGYSLMQSNSKTVPPTSHKKKQKYNNKTHIHTHTTTIQYRRVVWSQKTHYYKENVFRASVQS